MTTHRSSYEPDIHGDPLESVEVRAATPEDARGIAVIDSEWLEQTADKLEAAIARDLINLARGDSQRYVCVAQLHGKIVGYGKCGFLN